ncbi:MAG: thiol reductant ABC exporter subunit CydD [Anaerolineae bacterium]|nr:thiol reductant ABC exporter subunit CydD [Anaerolineae bacterium]
MNLDKRLLHLLRGERAALAITVSLGLAAGILLVLQAYFLSQTVSRVFLDGASLHAVRGLLVGLLIVGIARAGMLWGSETAAATSAAHIKTALRERLFAHLIALGPAHTRREHTGELAHTVVGGIDELDAYFSQYIPQLALAALIPLTMLILIAPIDLLSGIVLLVTAPLIPFFMILIGSMADTLTRRQFTQLSRLGAHFLDVLQGLTTLKLFGRSREQSQTIARISDQFRDATMNVLRVAFVSALALEMLSTLSTAIIAVEIGLRLLYGHMQFEDAFFVLILAPEFYLPLRLLGTRFHAGMSGAAAAARLFDILAIPAPETASTRVMQPMTDGDIRFENVFYVYSDGNHASERPALNGVSFTITPGQKVALVGLSGSGKSTVIQLMQRFIEPSAGHITVSGQPLHDIPADAWRDRIAWVPQRPYLFNASVADNIRLGRPDALLDAVIHAAQQAHADAFIRDLPAGYDTRIGERGARLSGGQAQRLALARAFLRNAPLLIMDEATANLDPHTEQLIQASIRALMHNRTALIVAHRLNTVQDADHIVVLDRGRVTAAGTHAVLAASGGPYTRLITAHSRRVDSAHD